jgi:hypothetical protein
MGNKMLLQKVEETIMKEIEENLITKSEVIQGLCSTCNNSTSCYYHLRNGKRIVWFCELFDDYEPILKFENFSSWNKSSIDSKTEEANKVKLAGLCMNCENRDTCTYPKPESGVWHCEEYC